MTEVKALHHDLFLIVNALMRIGKKSLGNQNQRKNRMAKQITLEIEHETIESIVLEELLEQLDYHEEYLREYEHSTREFIAIYSTDKKEDIKQIKKMIKALKRVIELYTVKDPLK